MILASKRINWIKLLKNNKSKKYERNSNRIWKWWYGQTIRITQKDNAIYISMIEFMLRMKFFAWLIRANNAITIVFFFYFNANSKDFRFRSWRKLIDNAFLCVCCWIKKFFSLETGKPIKYFGWSYWTDKLIVEVCFYPEDQWFWTTYQPKRSTLLIFTTKLFDGSLFSTWSSLS